MGIPNSQLTTFYSAKYQLTTIFLASSQSTTNFNDELLTFASLQRTLFRHNRIFLLSASQSLLGVGPTKIKV